ncbi:ANTAR domain-containing response regulator [Clostridium aminobutyricum]|uniref:Stage 0 sporulation protein A homolog n=1 Tax=Clostridium aminobutyricum TaxID=33953 RepID=A0A939DAQ6_CLOAM|nr:response regulator [Clostridium aminobutyricum]MBN7773823.1 response regulator [Clostridium aminobutyricum]
MREKEKKEIRIVIAEDEPITRMDLKEMLVVAGYSVVGEASEGFDAIEICKKEKPDVVILDIKMPLLDGLSAAKVITEEKNAGTIILLTAYSDEEFINRATKIGVSGYIVKPIDERALVPNIEIAVARSREIQQVKKQCELIAERLENRTIIEKAKGQLMVSMSLSENEAYEYIKNLSKEKKVSMKRIAEIILA